MEDCTLIRWDIWIGFLGTIFGAVIGGYIAYLIANFQFRKQEQQFKIQEKKDEKEKEIQLLWQIYFDIRKDCENSNLWSKYDELLQKRESVSATPTAEYIHNTLEYIMGDIKNYLKLLSSKECGIDLEKYNELDLLWERTEHLLSFIYEIYGKLKQFNKITTSKIISYYQESNELIQKHKSV